MAGNADINALTLHNIRHSFGGLAVLRDVSFTVPRGKTTGLIGPNGSGKSTLFNIVTGYLRPDGGRITFNGIELQNQSIQQRSYSGMIRTFQTPKVFETMTVFENVMVGCTKVAHSGFLSDMFRLPHSVNVKRKIQERAEEVCHKFDLVSIRNVLAGKLTAGQRRILEIARAIAANPSVLLLDEPSSGLSKVEIETLRHWINVLVDEGVTVLLISHDMELITVAETVHVLYFGEIIASGSREAIQRNARVREVYLGI